jgi:hypothetical protein
MGPHGHSIRHRRAGLGSAGAASFLMLFSVASCDASANHASTLIGQFRTYSILTTSPPGGVELARAEDKGSNSGITGRDPGIAVIFSTTSSVADTITYYQHAYPQYRISIDCCTSATVGTLLGSDGRVNIGINIATPQPYLIPHYNLNIKSTPSSAPIYVTVNVSGQPRGN